uniref:B18 n=1 Tax=Polytomella sp. Pringsheim 198.80 TaxID=37502 RepID=UPI001E1E2423|nr:Chain o, B18 [Polytomella sp. Pringsheim 198.80]7ARD_o Chain o, B18 [Polytomella sp. Pringsheim 198.80]|mmetsp:Transcript_22440/g.39810  ORF Transcript_22440/g.39810 Transcript_22440/m.39810 type:complete len:86 (+) Transcript_22440:104-361(+)|eukprot:CAMPEP_0175063646 /NCGR_PEP_ID=MMETSP0052_2-20121109/14879_1 /TAXON_ID=51329 ORGANISM="Polytomella parva, Strain SAG 63-3" /NCGR_SAMPLE_ID=MMETSP0052_2 /ASSEMBLY_ACC=CAM_ASM_000194 /LENGTH=85 /DNA_ID=CAMNT_0016329881 /DNA_START=65 /DNA_END=322 /DNA_ORIENTATION=+
MADRFPPPKMVATQEEMDNADIPYKYRDYCAHLIIDFKECRYGHPLTWRINCAHELHHYNKCSYIEFKRRVAIAIEEKKRRGLMV